MHCLDNFGSLLIENFGSSSGQEASKEELGRVDAACLILQIND